MLAGTLEVQMIAGMAKLTSELRQAKTEVSSFASHAEKALEGVKRAFGALGVGLGVAGLVKMIDATIDAADHMNDLSKATGIAIEKLSGLQLLAKQTGGDLDGMAASINKLSVNMGKDPQKFAALGVSAKDPIEALKQLSDIFVAIEDPQLRAAMAAQALGKSWASIAPALAEGGKKIGEIVERGERLSQITGAMGVNADAFKDDLAELNLMFAATKTKIVSDMLPGLIDITTAMKEAAKEGGLLLAVWVGLGGAFENIFGLGKVGTAVSWLAKVNAELKVLDKQIETGATNQNRVGGVRGFLADAGAMNAAQLADVFNQRRELLRQKAELEKIINPPQAQASTPDAAAQAAKAKATAETEARARAFAASQEATKAAAAELKKYEAALRSLEDQLGKFEGMTVAQKTANDLATGSLQGLTKAHGAHLIEVAKEIDAKKTQEAQTKSLIEAIEAETQAREVREGAMREAAQTQAIAVKDMRTETEMIGLNAVQREKAIALARIEADTTRQLAALSDMLNLPEQARQTEAVMRAREAAIATVNAEIDAKTEAMVLNTKNLEQLEFEITLIGMSNVQREQAIAVRQLEVTGIDQSTESYKRYVEQLKAVIANKGAVEESAKLWKDIGKAAEGAMSNFFFDVMQGKFDNLGARFKQTIDRMVADWLAAEAMKKLFGAAAGGGGGAMGGIVGGIALAIGSKFSQAPAPVVEAVMTAVPSKTGNVFDPRGIVPFARGGMVSRPTLFSFAGGMGLMGEAGAEAIMPLKRGADGRLGVVALLGSSNDRSIEMGQQRPVNVTNNFNISGNPDRASRAQVATAAGEGVARAVARNT